MTCKTSCWFLRSMDELLDIPDLTEEERNIILKVIQRDETLQKQTEDKAQWVHINETGDGIGGCEGMSA